LLLSYHKCEEIDENAGIIVSCIIGKDFLVTNDPTDLIASACRGDLVAFREIIDMYGAQIYSLVFQIVRDRDDAQDITQEVFIRLHTSLHTFNGQNRFTTWLYRLTTNIAIDFIRKNRKKWVFSLDETDIASVPADSALRPDIQMEMKETREIITGLLWELSPSQRKVFVLRDMQGFTTDETADILGCGVATVRVHLAQARLRIRKALKRRGSILNAREGL
jgi:RNA polymerase sigma-70 factor, ECF subfamily